MQQLTKEELARGLESTFVFFYRSSKAAPGKGSNEVVLHRFKELEGHVEFRQQLSNFFPCLIKAEDGRMFPSAEHFFHAEKMAMVDAQKATLFENGKKFGVMAPAKIKSLTGKSKLDMGDKLEEWDKRVPEVLERIWWLKFSQNESLKKMLLATMDARLMHYVKRRGRSAMYEHWTPLEKIRAELLHVEEE